MEDKYKLLGLLLKFVCEELQLSEVQVGKANDIHNDIAKFLQNSEDNRLKNADLFVQGSIATQTTVKPLSKEEFDLDMVCVIEDDKLTPQELLNLVLARLKEKKEYKDIVSSGEHKRNICLDFTKTFHLDIVPAIKSQNNEVLFIPNFNKNNQISWRQTNPKGFKEWFFTQVKKQKVGNKIFTGKPYEPLDTNGRTP